MRVTGDEGGKGAATRRETEELTQPENPGSAASQNSERESETTLHIPAASRILETTRTTDEAGKAVEITRTIIPAEATTQSTRSREKKGTVIGAAQKDTSRELATRLASMRPVQYAGIVLILAALAMFHPVVRAVTASVTLQIVTGATGLALVFAPMVVAGHEATILFAGLGLVAVWFFVHRHGRLQGMVDANHDGIDDREQRGEGTRPQA